MAKAPAATASTVQQLLNEINDGVFAPVYLLMGEEPYYVDMVADALLEKVLKEEERDFNQLVCYGPETTAREVVSNARRYPMFAERQLVMVREAQGLSNPGDLDAYMVKPLESTVLVLVYRGKMDKRTALFKDISNCGKVLESNCVKDYEMPRWIENFFASKSLSIEPEAARLFAESAGTDLGKIAVETEKMLKNLPENVKNVTVKDIETNVGVSREFSIFELTRQLSSRQKKQALRTAAYISSTARFAMPMATAALFMHFNRILKYEALLLQCPSPAQDDKIKVLGVNPYFFKEYDMAVRNFPLHKCMSVVALILDYDFKGKGGDSGAATPGELFMELVAKILET